MLFRIASRLGRTVDELSRTMTAAEFTEWCAFYSLEPWGYAVENWRAGMIGSTVANFVGKPKKAFTIEQFTPQRKKRQTPMQMLQLLRGIFGG